MVTKDLNNNNFESIEYEDSKNEEAILEIFKSPDWDVTVPAILEAIDSSKTDNTYGDYPYFKIQNTCQFIPQLSSSSEILNEAQLKELHSVLPYYHQYTNLRLMYSLSKDGCALKTFYLKANGISNSILVVRDDSGNIFGAYASEQYESQSKFYGTGECFLFTFYSSNRIHCFHTTALNDHYIYSDDSQVAFGCSDDYFSLVLENDFYSGYSKTTQTYKNPVLNGKEKFIIIKLELWAFQDK